ncbi:AAA family ATPase [Variovorax sp. OV700]|uniref:AAA family ATPase n=1 Tax=Variovorax sp. OV700 TaxID=1882826 RepID=UPI00088EF531|nr:AAA family ATPase [Variovorax sp. OV700]SDI18831.1 AAA domain-containing protein, putative AbiEii toxin, Type IV TA system [Variovorax sp. OV700]
MDVYIRDRHASVTLPEKSYPCVVLERDNWNDYAYYTLFKAQLRLAPGFGLGSVKNLGDVKIMKPNQAEGVDNRPFQKLGSGDRIPTRLLRDVCSLGSGSDYYDKLMQVEMDLAQALLSTLRDCSYLPAVRQRFQSDQCFKISLLRDSEARVLLDTAGARFGGGSTLISSFSAAIKLEGASAAHEFAFDFESLDGVPRRMHSIVGLNGVGKTQVMARLAILLSRFSKQAIKEKRSALQSDDSISPVPSIYSVVAVSFSAFDEFERPTQLQGEEFQYSYCGLQHPQGRLKTKDDLLKEIRAVLVRDMTQDKRDLLKRVLQNLVRVDDLESFVEEPENNKKMYQRLSAGQRLAINCIIHIISRIRPRTLILFDEPELHLHPQLLTGLLQALNEVLEHQDSFSIVATHSPLVIQQLPKECVHVIRRDRMTPMVVKPTFQTFGESVSEITRFVFASPDTDRDYRAVLERMLDDDGGDVEAVRQRFGGQLSLNADMYLESLRTAKDA